MFWVFIFIGFSFVLYLWVEVCKLKLMVASILLKEKVEDLQEEIMRDLGDTMGHLTDKD